ncbi:MAG TPA: BamA/TamA family outer membrane protein [Longimicrobium sp.]
MTPRLRSLRAALCAVLALAPAAARGQPPAGSGSADLPAGWARAAAGPRYRASGFRLWLMGESYRPLWDTPVAVPVLRPDTFAGGLAVDRAGGGRSTEALRLKGRNGVEYVFRSVDKNLTPAMPPDLRGTLPHAIAQDLVAAEHPGAALVAAPLLDAARVLHATPRLYLMPPHPFLREHRERFHDRLGAVEVRPTDGFAGAADVQGWEDFRKLLEDDPRNRVNAHNLLAARLMDVFLGDWDRRWDQWRWARFDADGIRWWKPVPRDRDNAFFDAEGVVASLARGWVPTLTRFGPEYDAMIRYHSHSAEVDRRLLSEPSRAVWDSLALTLRTRLTDAVIDDAVRHLPPEYLAQGGEELAATLKARRDALPEAAGRLYRLLAREVDVHATDRADRAEIVRRPDGSVDVVVHAAADPRGWPYFYRRFVPGETREVRVFLHGGNDVAIVRGAPGGILVRVIGGGGSDELRDQAADHGRTVFYVDRGENRVFPGTGARVDTRAWEEPQMRSLVGIPPRDWGTASSLFTPYATWELNVGPVVGVGPSWTRYGFRRTPYARTVGVRALWAPLEGGFGGMLRYDRKLTNRPAEVWLSARGSTFENVRFHGLGNDSPEDPDNDAFEVQQTQVRAQAAYEARPAPWVTLFAGPAAKWTDPGELDAPHAGVRGDESFWQAGLAGGVDVDERDDVVDPRHGARMWMTAEGYGSDLGSPFARLESEASGFLSVPGYAGPTLALRAGGQVAMGDYPFQESAFVGGPGNLRGFPWQRFRGDLALYGSAELRARIAYVNLGLARVHLGAFGLADAGRVMLDGDSPGGWHAGFGGGVSLRTLGHSGTIAYAHGERGIIYVTFGMPY